MIEKDNYYLIITITKLLEKALPEAQKLSESLQNDIAKNC
jgi:hypothetical protein